MIPQNPQLFKSLMPYGGQLDTNNQWIRLRELVPWSALSEIHDRYFCVQRVGKKKANQLIIGLLIGKTVRGLSDVGILEYFYENPYFQYFCGLENFVTPKMKKVVDPSLLSKRRKKLGSKCFEEFEKEIQKLLIKYKLIKADTLMLDATVFPSNIEYPNDVKLMNVVREYCSKNILLIKNKLNPKRKIRTYARLARKVYLNFQKKKKKTKKSIQKAKKQMMQYLRRNIQQLELLLLEFEENLKQSSNAISSLLEQALVDGIRKQLETGKSIFDQQFYMIQNKVNSVKDRIVSFHQPYVRPIVRGKEKAAAEFGPKAHLAYVNGFVFLDKLSFDAFSEQKELPFSLEKHQERFSKLPKITLIDDAYSSRENRALLTEKAIEHSLKLIGKPPNDVKKKYRKTKLRKKRSEVEGIIGILKEHWNMDKIRFPGKDGAKIQSYLTFGCHNLVKAAKAMS